MTHLSPAEPRGLSIVQRGKSWRLRMEGATVDGKRTFTYETFPSKAQAELRKAQIMAGVAGPEAAGSGRGPSPVLSVYGDAWVDEREALGIVQPQSAVQYRTAFRIHVWPEIGHLRLEEITTAVVRTALANIAKSVSPRYLSSIRTRLSALLNSAVTDGHLRNNPARAIKLPKFGASAGKLMSMEERTRLAVACRRHRLGPLVKLAVATGLRRGELAGLRWRDVDVAACTVTVSETVKVTPAGDQRGEPKTESSRRTLKVSEAIMGELERLRQARQEEADFRQRDLMELSVFTTAHGRSWSPNSLTNAISDFFKAIGLGAYSIHDLRHLHASALLTARHNMKAVSVRLGHSDPKITMSIYAHLLPNDDDALAATAGTILGE